MPISKTLHLSLAKADIHIPVDTEPDMLGRVIEAAQRQRTETKRRVRLGLPIGNVRLSEWERVTLQRGPNKGKTAWKKGNRYFHGEKPPEGRGGKQEAGTKGKSAPKPKANKMTPQAMVEKHKAIMAKGSTSHDDMQGFIDDLLTMTVKDINEVKKSLGLKASGKKAELAKKIGQKAFELVGKGKAAEVKKPKQESSPTKKPEFSSEMTKALEYEGLFRGQEDFVPLPKLYKRMKKANPDLTENDFKNEIGKLWDSKKIDLHELNEKHKANSEEKNLGIHTNDNKNLWYYISTKVDSMSEQAKPEQAKPEPKQADKNIDSMSPGELYKYAKELGITPGKSKPQNMKLIKDHLGKNEGQ